MNKKVNYLSCYPNASVVFLIGIGIILMCNANAIEPPQLGCFTEKPIYQQGENVIITIINNTNTKTFVTDRNDIDGGFATIEMKREGGTWGAIELFAAANVIMFKTLKPGDSHVYTWRTMGYNRSNTLAAPGTYRILFNDGLCSNQFEIRRKIRP